MKMRNAFVKTLTEIARTDHNVMLLTGDLGFGVLTDYAKELPDQFINVGVAEQNMTSLAAGLALEGKNVFTYSIANFNTLRCVEQIRSDICYHNAKVTIVNIGGGFCYGALGISHHATEDIAIMRAIPNLKVVAPGDIVETRLATKAIYEMEGPCFLRLGRGNEPQVHESYPQFKIGQAITLQAEGEVAILSTGGILQNVVVAAELLKAKGIAVSIHSIHTLKPFDFELIEKLSKRSRLIVTVEEHIISGGLGGLVAETLVEIPKPIPLLIRIGVGEGFTCEVGNQNYLRGLHGLNPSQIAERIRRSLS